MALSSDLSKLSVQDRLQLVEDLWDSIAADADALPVTAAQRREIENRLVNLDQPTYTWEQVKKRARTELRINGRSTGTQGR